MNCGCHQGTCVDYAKLKMHVSSVIDYNILSFEYFELIYLKNKERNFSTKVKKASQK